MTSIGTMTRNDDDPYFVAVRDALHLSEGFINSLASFTVNQQVFINRPSVYSTRARRQALVETFEGILLEVVQTGVPAGLRSTGVSPDVKRTMIVGVHTRTFGTTTLPVFKEVARNVVQNAAKLGFG